MQRFAILDAGMNDFLVPRSMMPHHEIVCVAQAKRAPEETYDVVGPVCETSDFFGRPSSAATPARRFVAIRMTGAYGAAMASAYNARPPAAEVLVTGSDGALCGQE